MVRKVDSGGIGGLQEGDVILTLNDKLISRVTDLDIMYNNSELDAVIVRKREEMRIKVATVPTADLETDRVLAFCGAVLHRPHHAVRQQISKVHSDVYVSGRVSLFFFFPLSLFFFSQNRAARLLSKNAKIK